MNNNSALPLTVVIMMSICLLIFAGRILNLENKSHKLNQTIAHYEETYLRKQGATSIWKGSHGEMLNYEFRSFDGGKKWYAVSYDRNGGLIVMGEADAVYPGLLSHLQGMDALFGAVLKNGPLNLDHPKSVELLKNAGFDIVTSTNN